MTCMAGWSSRVVCQSVTAGPGFCPRPQPSIWPGGVGRGLAGDPPPPAACAQVLGADKHPSAPPTPGGQLAGLIYLLQNPDMLQVRLHKPPTPPPSPPPPPPPGPLPQTTPSHPLIRLGHTQVEGLEIKDINVLTQLQLHLHSISAASLDKDNPTTTLVTLRQATFYYTTRTRCNIGPIYSHFDDGTNALAALICYSTFTLRMPNTNDISTSGTELSHTIGPNPHVTQWSKITYPSWVPLYTFKGHCLYRLTWQFENPDPLRYIFTEVWAGEGWAALSLPASHEQLSRASGWGLSASATRRLSAANMNNWLSKGSTKGSRQRSPASTQSTSLYISHLLNIIVTAREAYV